MLGDPVERALFSTGYSNDTSVRGKRGSWASQCRIKGGQRAS